jgi:hypothetical protein
MENYMTTYNLIGKYVPRTAVIVLALLICAGTLKPAHANPSSSEFNQFSTSAFDDEGVHRPLAAVGITQGQTARINVVNSPDPQSANPPSAISVEMCFHDSNGDLILDRSRRPVQKSAIIDPHHAVSLDLIGGLVAAPGSRVLIIPCVRILRIADGSIAVPTLELYNNLVKTTSILSPGIARGFDPQPDPPAPEVAFGMVGVTQGQTVRLYVNNALNPARAESPAPVTVEITLHDANHEIFVDRRGRPAQKVVTLNPNQVDFLELNGNDIADLASPVGIIPCVKVLRGSSSSLVVPTFEMYGNFTQQTLLLSNFVGDPNAPVRNR